MVAHIFKVKPSSIQWVGFERATKSTILAIDANSGPWKKFHCRRSGIYQLQWGLLQASATAANVISNYSTILRIVMRWWFLGQQNNTTVCILPYRRLVIVAVKVRVWLWIRFWLIIRLYIYEASIHPADNLIRLLYKLHNDTNKFKANRRLTLDNLMQREWELKGGLKGVYREKVVLKSINKAQI